jgi:imidazolonepropionase-like amidohydrolase
MRSILRPEWLIDGTGAPPQTRQAVVIQDTSVDAVSPADQTPILEGDQVLDLPGATLIPGLINNHVHLVLPGDNTPFPMVQLETDSTLALRAACNIRQSLCAGVTTVRDCGGRGAIAVDVRDAQAKGFVPGSRVFTTAWPVTITGGHERYFGGEADGVDGLTRAVRRVVSGGADFIKVLASGGGTPGSLSQYPSFSVAELRTIVEVAHGLGRLVAAHCIATASISNAIEAGVDLIEHALFLDADGVTRYDPRVAERLAESGIPVSTTMQVARDLVDLGPDVQDYDRWVRMRDSDREIKSRLRGLGIRLVAGSDAGWRATTFSTFWKELDELVTIGMSATEAIQSATLSSAEALRQGRYYGAIRPGLSADLVAVGGDASHDIHCVADVRMVFLAGKLLRPATLG